MLRKYYKLILCILFALLVFIPNVNASNEIEVKSIILNSKSSKANLTNDPTASGLLVKSDIELKKVNDYVEYKIVIDNPTSKDYTIKENSSKSEYIAYEYRYDDDNKILEKEKESILYLKIKYNSEVPSSAFIDDELVETEDILIDLIYNTSETTEISNAEDNKNTSNNQTSNNTTKVDTNKKLMNPVTGDSIVIWVLILTTSIAISLVLFFTKNEKRYLSIIIVGLLILPFSIFANEEIQIKIESKVTIKGKNSVTETIYWALQDNDSNGTNETLKIADHELTGSYSGHFNGDIKYTYESDVPWSKTSYNYMDNNLAKDVTTVKIEGIVAPKYTTNWFNGVGYRVASFTADLTNLDVNNVESMNNMFYQTGYNATEWSIGDISDWDTSKVTNMRCMFTQAGYNATTWSIGNVTNWDTSKVTDMYNTFAYAGKQSSKFNLNVSNWNTSSATTMSGMFGWTGESATEWSIGDLSNWNTSKVIDMSRMFASSGYSATTFNIGSLNNWDTSNVNEIREMFNDAGYSATTFNIGDLSKWDISNVTSTLNLFSSAGFNATTFNIGDLSNWNTSKVTDMSNTFERAGSNATEWFVGSLNNWDTSNVTNMWSMFYAAGSNATIFNLDLSNWNTSKVTNMNGMLSRTGVSSTTWSVGDLSNWDTSKVTDMGGMFQDAAKSTATFNLNISGWDTHNVVKLSYMFCRAGQNATSWNVKVPKTNGNGISNTTETIYGSSTSVYAHANDYMLGKAFTLSE